MSTQLPYDSNNNPIPVLRLRDGGAHALSVSASSSRNSTAFDSNTKVISLYADVPVYVNFGGASVSATSNDHYFPASLYYDIAVGDERVGHYTHIAVLRADTDGTVYVSEKE